jgi:hypothetical protein
MLVHPEHGCSLAEYVGALIAITRWSLAAERIATRLAEYAASISVGYQRVDRLPMQTSV